MASVSHMPLPHLELTLPLEGNSISVVSSPLTLTLTLSSLAGRRFSTQPELRVTCQKGKLNTELEKTRCLRLALVSSGPVRVHQAPSSRSKSWTVQATGAWKVEGAGRCVCLASGAGWGWGVPALPPWAGHTDVGHYKASQTATQSIPWTTRLVLRCRPCGELWLGDASRVCRLLG